MMANEILILGATGKIGKRAAGKLQKMGIPVRAGSRNGNPPFDWDKPGKASQVGVWNS